MSMHGHFYFSAKQKNISHGWHEGFGWGLSMSNRKTVTICKLDTGKIVEYSQMSTEPMPEPYNWDDMVYLGEGVVYSIDGVVQR